MLKTIEESELAQLDQKAQNALLDEIQGTANVKSASSAKGVAGSLEERKLGLAVSGIQFVKSISYPEKYTDEYVFRYTITYKGIPVRDFHAKARMDIKTYIPKSTDFSKASYLYDNPINISPKEDIDKGKLPEIIFDYYKKTKGIDYPAEIFDFNPTLEFYLDANREKWRLVYVTNHELKNVQDSEREKTYSLLDSLDSVQEPEDFIIDAHTGEVVATLPCLDKS